MLLKARLPQSRVQKKHENTRALCFSSRATAPRPVSSALAVTHHYNLSTHGAPAAQSRHVHPLKATAKEEQPAKQHWWEKGGAPNMRDVHGVQELVNQLAEAGDKLAVVEFFAPWCNACKAMYPKLVRIMWDEHPGDALCFKVNFEENRDMCKTMGIMTLPFFHIYHGSEGRVEAFNCTVSKVQRLRDALARHGACDLPAQPQQAAPVKEFPEVQAHVGMAAAAAEPDEAYPPEADRPTRLSDVVEGWGRA